MLNSMKPDITRNQIVRCFSTHPTLSLTRSIRFSFTICFLPTNPQTSPAQTAFHSFPWLHVEYFYLYLLDLPPHPTRVAVLQGGLPAWRAKGLPLETDNPPTDDVMFAASRACASPPATTRYRAVLDKSKVRPWGSGVCMCVLRRPLRRRTEYRCLLRP